MPDYRNYNDEQLDALFRGGGTHIDYAAIVAEHQRRQNQRDNEAAKERHTENKTLVEKTLFWAKIAAIATIAGTLALLAVDIPFSKLLPSKASQASPTSSPKASVTVSPSLAPTATESPSESPKASPTPVLTSTPE
jgi:hypothetical protein